MVFRRIRTTRSKTGQPEPEPRPARPSPRAGMALVPLQGRFKNWEGGGYILSTISTPICKMDSDEDPYHEFDVGNLDPNDVFRHKFKQHGMSYEGTFGDGDVLKITIGIFRPICMLNCLIPGDSKDMAPLLLLLIGIRICRGRLRRRGQQRALIAS